MIRLILLSRSPSIFKIVAYLQAQKGIGVLSEEKIKDIYRVSQGIPFFLSEYAEQLLRGEKFQPLTPAIKAKLSLKLDHLSSGEEELLDYLACFREPASLSFLTKLLALPVEDLVEIIEALRQKRLLIEVEEEDRLVVNFSQEPPANICL